MPDCSREQKSQTTIAAFALRCETRRVPGHFRDQRIAQSGSGPDDQARGDGPVYGIESLKGTRTLIVDDIGYYIMIGLLVAAAGYSVAGKGKPKPALSRGKRKLAIIC